jgi:hypothetical protein
MKRSDRELLKDALAAFDEIRIVETRDYQDLIEEIRTRLAEPEDAPFAWYSPGHMETYMATWYKPREGDLPLYRHPPRQPERLSDDEINECFDIAQRAFHKHQSGIKGQQLTIRDWPHWHFAKAIEQAMMEKNK